MNIAHITPSFYPATAYGGPLESVYALCRSVGSEGCRVRVLTTDADGRRTIDTVEKNKDIPLAENVEIRYCKRWWPESISPSLLASLHDYVSWADVVHLMAVYSFPTIPTLMTCKALKKPLVWSPRGALERWGGTRRQAGKAVWESACRIFFPERLALHVTSDEEGQKSLKRFPGIRMAVIPNGVEASPPTPLPKGEGGGRPGEATLHLLFLGRLDPKKGIENLLEACRQLNGQLGRPWDLKIAGSGDAHYERKIQSYIEEKGLRRQVSMAGFVQGPEKQKLFHEADVVVAPSHTENFCMVVAEALAAGTPVIASQGTPWKRVEDMGCGLWVSNEPASLTRAISEISRKPLREMGERGRQWMQKEFTWKEVGRRMVELYQSMRVVPV